MWLEQHFAILTNFVIWIAYFLNIRIFKITYVWSRLSVNKELPSIFLLKEKSDKTFKYNNLQQTIGFESQLLINGNSIINYIKMVICLFLFILPQKQ